MVEAVAQGQFHIHAISHVDEAIEVLTGLPAGKREAKGFAQGTVNARVDQRLAGFANTLRDFIKPTETLAAPSHATSGGALEDSAYD